MRYSLIAVLAAVLFFPPGCSDDDSTTAPSKQTVATPQLDPAGGSYDAIQYVKMDCSTTGASVYYTGDGSDPDETSTLCPPGDSVEVAVTTTLKARAYKDGMNPSDIAEATFTIDFPNVATPYFDPDPGLYNGPVNVAIMCATAFPRIFYTTDGSEPDTNSTEFIFQTVIPVATTTTIRARAYKEGMDPSPVISGEFAIIDGLVAYYPFEGSAGDVSGNNHNGTVHGATLVADRFGTAEAAFDFDGTDDYIEIPHEASFDFTEFTISFWTHYSTLPTVPDPSTSGYYCAVSKAGVNLGNYTVRLTKSGGASYCTLSYAHGTSTGNWNTGCWENIYRDQYYHIVVTVSDEARIYYNGVHHCTSSSMPPPIQTNGNVLIGKYDSASYPWHFNGIIDDVRFYNRALSASEIEDLHQAESQQGG